MPAHKPSSCMCTMLRGRHRGGASSATSAATRIDRGFCLGDEGDAAYQSAQTFLREFHRHESTLRAIAEEDETDNSMNEDCDLHLVPSTMRRHTAVNCLTSLVSPLERGPEGPATGNRDIATTSAWDQHYRVNLGDDDDCDRQSADESSPQQCWRMVQQEQENEGNNDDWGQFPLDQQGTSQQSRVSLASGSCGACFSSSSWKAQLPPRPLVRRSNFR